MKPWGKIHEKKLSRVEKDFEKHQERREKEKQKNREREVYESYDGKVHILHIV